MKQLNFNMDANGHVTTSGFAGVVGDHNALSLNITLAPPPEGVSFYRLFFSGESGSVMSQRLVPAKDEIRYLLPEKVTALGHTVLCQLCGYALNEDKTELRFQSDSVALSLGSSLQSLPEFSDSVLVDELQQTLNELETFAASFGLTVGQVQTLPAGSDAAVSLSHNGYRYELNFSLPRGKDGGITGLTVGPGLELEQGRLSLNADELKELLGKAVRPTVYNGVYSAYEYTGIDEPLPLSALANSLLLICPAYAVAGKSSVLFTTGEQIYHTLYCLTDDGAVTATLPENSIVEGRLMAVYVDGEGRPVYLNPKKQTRDQTLPVYELKVLNPDTSFPQLDPVGLNYSDCANGLTLVGLPQEDLVFSGKLWCGPLASALMVYSGGKWVNASLVAGRLKAGRPILLYLEYNASGYTFTSRLLTPPENDDWHSLTVSSVSSTGDPLLLHYKRTGEAVYLRFSGGSAAATLSAKTLLATLPAEARPAYADAQTGLYLCAAAANGPLPFCLYPTGELSFAPSGDETLRPQDWQGLTLSYAV